MELILHSFPSPPRVVEQALMLVWVLNKGGVASTLSLEGVPQRPSQPGAARVKRQQDPV
jgi:hypothetical protein